MTNYMTMFMCGNAASAMRAFAAAAFLLFLLAGLHEDGGACFRTG